MCLSWFFKIQFFEMLIMNKNFSLSLYLMLVVYIF